MKTASGAMYKDATTADFDHYFKGCAMLLKIPTDKRRLYVVEGVGSGPVITGSYLTRQREWKEKTIKFNDWYQVLDAILPHAQYFNIGNAAGYWIPSVSRNTGGLKKAFMYNTSRVTLFGAPSAEDSTEQNVAAAAFSDAYGGVADVSGDAALRSTRSAALISGDFILDLVKGKAYYRHNPIGKIEDRVIQLDHKRKVFRDLLISSGGVSPKNVIIMPPVQEEEAKPKVSPAQTLGAAFNPGNLGAIHSQINQGLMANQALWDTTTQVGAWGSFNAAPAHPQPPHDVGTHFNTVRANDTVSIDTDDIAFPLPHPTRFFHGEAYHRNTPATTSNLGYLIGAYSRAPANLATWVRPRWGRGYAIRREDGMVVNVRGPVPDALPAGYILYTVWVVMI